MLVRSGSIVDPSPLRPAVLNKSVFIDPSPESIADWFPTLQCCKYWRYNKSKTANLAFIDSIKLFIILRDLVLGVINLFVFAL